jgi:ABC-type uncharacterized transport system involved in gliding motility auxiliary subunit
VTADKPHTLTAGTKKILSDLDSRVMVRRSCTQGDNAMPPALKAYSRRIEDMLREYEQQAQGKLLIEKFDPKPDSDAEESARINGVEGRATGPFGSDKIYLGIVVSQLDDKFVLPWLSPERGRLLEYDISRAISRVASHTRPVVGVMSGLPVFGEPPSLLKRPDAEPMEDWAFLKELKKDFNVKEVPLTASKIDEEIKVLLVAHPVNISDSTLYAIDQFVLRGGKLLAFLDPHAYFDQIHDRSENYTVAGDNAAKSSLDKLLKAWGLQMDVDRVAADTSFASRNLQSGDIMPTLLLVTRSGIDEQDIVTSQIDNLLFPFAGAFVGKPVDGLKETVLVKCSPNSELVDTLIATAASEQILRNFKPTHVEYPLAVHLTGNFKTAFPNGEPQKNSKDPSDSSAQLKTSNGKGEVVLVADTDMLNDRMCIRVENVMGHPVARQLNGNLNFVQSLVEEFSGDDDLITSRSRASLNHPFTRLKDMEIKAGRQWEQKIKELQMQKDGSNPQDIILSPQQQKELDQYQKNRVAISKDLKQLRKNLRKDTEALEFWTKVTNIAAMPMFVMFSGILFAGVKKRGNPRPIR